MTFALGWRAAPAAVALCLAAVAATSLWVSVAQVGEPSVQIAYLKKLPFETNNFGRAVSEHGDVAVVGSEAEESNRGAAYVFMRDQGGAKNWGLVKRLIAPNRVANDFFGTSVAISGDLVVVGARNLVPPGRACIFSRNVGGADNWGFVKQLVPPDALPAIVLALPSLRTATWSW